ncbi:retrotransposon gag protein [Tanacetum coccineum]
MPPRKDTSNDNAPTSFQDQLSALNAKVDALVNSMTNLLQPPAAAPPPPNNPLHKSPKIMLPTFDGTCPLDWLFQADQYFTFYNIPVDQRVFYCRLSSSKVMLWLVTSKCNNNGLLGDWVTFTRALELRFGPSSFANHQAALFKLKQDGSVATYQTEFERLSNCVVGLPHTALLNCFILGLRPDIQQEIAIYHPSTLHQTYGLAKLIEDKLAATQSQFTSSTGPPFISPTTQTTTTQPVTKPPAILPNPVKQTTPFTISDTGLNQLGGANSGDIQTHQFLALSAAALHGTTCPLAIRITGQINCDTLVQCWWTSGSSLLSSTLSQFHYCTSHSIPNPHFPYDWYWYRFSIARAMPQHSTLRSFRYLIFLYLRCFPLLKVLDVSVRHCPWLCRPRASQKADFSGATTYFNSPREKEVVSTCCISFMVSANLASSIGGMKWLFFGLGLHAHINTPILKNGIVLKAEVLCLARFASFPRWFWLGLKKNKQILDIPFNYLGLPIGSNMKSIASWKTLVDLPFKILRSS